MSGRPAGAVTEAADDDFDPSEVVELAADLVRLRTVHDGNGGDVERPAVDLLGIREGKGAKFVRRYADLLDAMADGIADYAREVREVSFPGPEHGYGIGEAELAKFRQLRADADPRP